MSGRACQPWQLTDPNTNHNAHPRALLPGAGIYEDGCHIARTSTSWRPHPPQQQLQQWTTSTSNWERDMRRVRGLSHNEEVPHYRGASTTTEEYHSETSHRRSSIYYSRLRRQPPSSVLSDATTSCFRATTTALLNTCWINGSRYNVASRAVSTV